MMQQQFQQPEEQGSGARLQTAPTREEQPTLQQDDEATPALLKRRKRRPRSRAVGLEQSGQHVSRWRRRKRAILGISAVLFPISLLITLLLMVGLRDVNFQPPPSLMTLVRIVLILIPASVPVSLVGLIVGILMRPTRRDTLEALYASDDVHAIGPLLDASEMLMPDVKEDAVTGLIPLLARVRAADEVALTAAQRNRLRQLLQTNPLAAGGEQAPAQEPAAAPAEAYWQERIAEQHRFALAALHALAEIGTGRDLPVVERLASGQGVARYDPQVHEAAQNCLPILRARAEEERSSNTYLRASQQPEAHNELLLRAAVAHTATEPQHLLRAAHTEQEPPTLN